MKSAILTAIISKDSNNLNSVVKSHYVCIINVEETYGAFTSTFRNAEFHLGFCQKSLMEPFSKMFVPKLLLQFFSKGSIIDFFQGPEHTSFHLEVTLPLTK